MKPSRVKRFPFILLIQKGSHLYCLRRNLLEFPKELVPGKGCSFRSKGANLYVGTRVYTAKK